MVCKSGGPSIIQGFLVEHFLFLILLKSGGRANASPLHPLIPTAQLRQQLLRAHFNASHTECNAPPRTLPTPHIGLVRYNVFRNVKRKKRYTVFPQMVSSLYYFPAVLFSPLIFQKISSKNLESEGLKYLEICQ